MYYAWVDSKGQEANNAGGVILPWWSVTKTAIAALVIRQASCEGIDLDAPLPGKAWSLRHLMAHQAGLRDYGAVPEYHKAVSAGELPWADADMLDRANADDPLWPPGGDFAYSNIGYFYLRLWLEERTGRNLAELMTSQLIEPLDLNSAKLAETPADFATIPLAGAEGYHPGWVFHRTLVGTAREAARMVRAIVAGDFLTDAQKADMQETHFRGGALDGRPWLTTGYGLGLMIGQTGTAGLAVGHSGSGPFSSNAVYHFPDSGRTVAVFGPGSNEAEKEWRAARLAQSR